MVLAVVAYEGKQPESMIKNIFSPFIEGIFPPAVDKVNSFRTLFQQFQFLHICFKRIVLVLLCLLTAIYMSRLSIVAYIFTTSNPNI